MKTLWERLQSLSQEDKDRYKDEELSESDFDFFEENTWESDTWEDTEPSVSVFFHRRGNKTFAGFERCCHE